MPNFCLVVGCSSNSAKDKLSFFRVPAVFDNNKRYDELRAKRRKAWVQALKRMDLTESKLNNDRICSKHFISGKPATIRDVNNPDWVPSLNMGYTSTLGQQSSMDRYKRLENRNKLLVDIKSCETASEGRIDESVTSGDAMSVQDDSDNSLMNLTKEIDRLQLEVVNCNKEIYNLRNRLSKLEFNIENFKKDNSFTLYYTGLPALY